MDPNPVRAESYILHFQCHLFQKSLRKKHWLGPVSHQAIIDIYKDHQYHNNSAHKQKLVSEVLTPDNPGNGGLINSYNRNPGTAVSPLDSRLFELYLSFDIVKF